MPSAPQTIWHSPGQASAPSPSGRDGVPIRVLLADDHAIFREGLRRILETHPDLRVIGEAADGRQALRLVRELGPDILLLDATMPEMSGLAVLRELAADRGAPKVVLLTAGIDKGECVEALRLGARGIVPKLHPAEALLKGIRAVMGGEHWVSRELINDLAKAVAGLDATFPSSAAGPEISPREHEVVALLAEGMTNRQIAKRLQISTDTVKHHLTSLFDKTGASTRVELALYAVSHGLGQPARRESRPV